MYSTSIPVTAAGFFDRQDELATLERSVQNLQAGSPSWLAIIGPRKIGKTSLLLELSRRAAEPSVAFVLIDCFEELPPAIDIFTRYALRLVDAALGSEVGTSLEALAPRPAEFRKALQHSQSFDALPPVLRGQLLELAGREADAATLHPILDLPERLAEALGLYFVVVWDEFQELAASSSRRGTPDLLPLMRSRWQRHQRTTYVISGSARTMLSELVTDERSPFFQHFSLLELGPFRRREAIGLLIDNAPPERPLSTELAARAVDIFGGHPFYLQLLGEALTRQLPGSDDATFKEALQELLFSRTGRLALYFENELQRLVGRSGYLAKTLEVLAAGPRRAAEVARAIDSASGATAGYLERLKDAVVRTPDGAYALADPVFGLWLGWRQPGGTVVPMRIVGDEAEQAVAAALARLGFDLVYQSRASRGAFDLLATRGPHQIGIQVKRTPLPLRFGAAAWKRMEAEAKRFGWRWVVAVLTPPPDHRLLLLDPAKARVRKMATLDAGAAIDNLLLWVDRPERGDRDSARRPPEE
jgi:AAA+ ATPase superfamily predicted ATPase